jgi:hypothetical protein
MLGGSQALGVLLEALDAEQFRPDGLFEWPWNELEEAEGLRK